MHRFIVNRMILILKFRTEIDFRSLAKFENSNFLLFFGEYAGNRGNDFQSFEIAVGGM